MDARLLLCAVASVGLAACGDDQASSRVELSMGGACADVHFWAATVSGDVAVTVTVEARDRSRIEPMTQDFAVPDGAVVVEVLEGDDLDRNFCTDVVDATSEPQDQQGVVAGHGTITLDPVPQGPDHLSCGTVSGELELTGLEAADGTTFGPIRVMSDSIGCYSG